MVLAWIGIGLGVLIVVVLIVKLLKTPRYESLKAKPHCKKCGYPTEDLKCPRCGRSSK